MYTPSIDGADCFRAAVMQGDITIGWRDPVGGTHMLNVGDIDPGSLDEVLDVFREHQLERITPLLQNWDPAALVTPPSSPTPPVGEYVEMPPVLSGRHATAEEWEGFG